jgi:hypothetical protein
MTHVPSFALVDPIAALHAHFTAALAFLRASPPPGLDAAQRLTRALLLRELEVYADRGVFPQNRRAPGERRPTFVDDNGVLCAVAHLLDLTGQGALALEVRDTRNDATVAELSGDARFAAWARSVGFTLEELALVQPSYCDVPRYACVCYRAGPLAEGEALVVLASTGGERVEVREVVEARFPLATGSVSAGRAGRPLDAGVFLARVSRGESPGALEVIDLFSASEGESPCGAWASPALPVARADLARALLSAGEGACANYLVSLDPKWSETGLEIDPVAARCPRRELEAPVALDTRGCALAADPAPAPAAESLVVLAALLTALAARKARSRGARVRPPSARTHEPRTT